MEEERCREVRGVNSWSNCRISYVNVHVVRCAGSEVAGVRGCASPNRPLFRLRTAPQENRRKGFFVPSMPEDRYM